MATKACLRVLLRSRNSRPSVRTQSWSSIENAKLLTSAKKICSIPKKRKLCISRESNAGLIDGNDDCG